MAWLPAWLLRGFLPLSQAAVSRLVASIRRGISSPTQFLRQFLTSDHGLVDVRRGGKIERSGVADGGSGSSGETRDEEPGNKL